MKYTTAFRSTVWRTVLQSVICLFALSACNDGGVASGSGAVSNIAPEEAWALLQKDETVQVLDVRTPPEVAEGTLPEVRVVADWHQWEQTWPDAKQKLDPERPVLVYCRSGRRSSAAAAFLADHGFKHVLNLEGGIGAWIRAGLPVER